MRTAMMAIVVTILAAGVAGGASSLDIYEDDNAPAEGGTYPYKSLSGLTWNYHVKNNSHINTNSPLNEKIRDIQLYSIYSVTTPEIRSIPDGWSGTFESMSTNVWKITFDCSDYSSYGVVPGDEKMFAVETYKPSGFQLTAGSIYGRAVFDPSGWRPVGSYNEFFGPVGASSDVFTKTILEISEDDGIPEGSGTNYLWRFILKNNSDTEPTNQPYMTNVTQVVMSNIYSSVQPTFTSLPSGWTGSNVFLSPLPYGLNNSNMWMLVLTATNSGIPPGTISTSQITTYVPSGYQAPVTGTIEGAEGYLPNPNFGWMTASGFVGPVAKPIPEPLSDGMVGILMVLAARYRLKRNARTAR